ncbi:MAG: hypothetical protein NTAFB01_15000 [Nitrospira sp.]
MDLDLYSSTKNAFKVFEVDERLLLPRIFCYRDDILGYTYDDHNGERLAMSDSNARFSLCKFSPVYGLKYYVPPQDKSSAWTDKFYYLRAFDHTLYKHPDSLLEDTCIDLRGKRETSVVASTGQQNIDR